MAFDNNGRWMPDAPGQQSVTQQAGRGGAQSVSNYMGALQNAGASNNNAAMNAPGQLGHNNMSGFQGFNHAQQSYGPSYVQQNNTGPMQSQLGAQQNQSNLSNNYSQNNQAQQSYGFGGGQVNPGGTGGVQNQPQWQTPQPWGQVGNANLGTPGTMRAEEGMGQYTAGSWENPKRDNQGNVVNPAPITQGSFYSQAPPGYAGTNGGPPAAAPANTQNNMSQMKSTVMSDENAKQNISSAKGELQEFLDSLGVHSYEYKNKEHGEGRFISPMAQEFEKSKLGKDAVVETPEGLKMVNYGRIAGVQTAALALLNHKYNELEKRFNEKLNDRLSKKKNQER